MTERVVRELDGQRKSGIVGGNSYTGSDGKSYADSAEKGVMEKTSRFGKLELKVIPAFTYPTTKVSLKCQQKRFSF